MKLGREDVPDEVWEHVIKLGLVHDAIKHGDDGSWRELLTEAKDRLRELREDAGMLIPPGRGKGEGARSVPQEIALEPSEHATERAEAFAEIAGIMGNRHPKVTQFRRMHLGGRLLTDGEAREFLNRRCDGPRPTTHGANAVSRKLWKLAEKLSKTYLWQENDAMWFVLTGYVPSVKPLEVRVLITPPRSMGLPPVPKDYHPSTARITITADAWVSAGEVEGAFRDAQRQILGGDARTTRKARTLAVVKFVARWMRDHPEKSWEELLRAWNETYPKWRYKDFRGLRQAFERFVHREYNIPNYRRAEKTPYQAYRDEWMKRFKGTG